MELLLALVAGVLYATGFYLMLRRRLAQLIIGLGLLANGSNMLIFTAAGLTRGPAAGRPGGGRGAPAIVRRPGAAVADSDRHRHRLRRARVLPGAGAPRPPRRRGPTTSTRSGRTRRDAARSAHPHAAGDGHRRCSCCRTAHGCCAAVAFAGAVGILAAAIALLVRVEAGGIQVLQIGAWPAPFGITLVADLFSALLVVMVGIIGVVVTGALVLRRRSPARSVRLSRADPRPADGRVRGVPDRRHLQPVRLVRGDADRLVRADGAASHARAAPRRLHVRHPEPAGVGGAADGDRPPVRAGGHAEPRRPRPRLAGAANAGARRGAGDAVPDRVRHQGRPVSAVLLAAGVVSHAAGGGRRAVRRTADEGRRLRADPRLHAAVSAMPQAACTRSSSCCR